MKQIAYLLLSGIVGLAACQNKLSKQTDKNIQDIDNIKQETNIDSLKQNAKLDSVKQVLAQTTDPLKRIKLHQQIIDIKIEGTSPEERCQLFDDYSTEVQKELKFYTKYIKQLPKYYQDYWYLIKDAENIAPDACLIITWHELSNLLARYETYVKRYPTQKELFCRLKDDYKFLQSAFLFGVDNTSTVDFDSVDKKIKEEWKRFIRTYPDSPTTPFIKEMLLLNKYEDMYSIQQKLIRFQETSNYPLLKTCTFKR